MDSNFDMISYLSNQRLDREEEVSSESDHSHKSMRQINELNHTIDVQRKIIAEQAVKVKQLQEKLKKYGWNM